MPCGPNERPIWSIFRFRDDTLETVALSGDQIPGIPGAEYNHMGTPSMNAYDSMAFHAWLQGAGVNNTNDQGLFARGFGGLNTIVREGWGAPGRPNEHFGTLDVTNKDAFFGAADEVVDGVPAGIKPIQFLPSTDSKHAVCLWAETQ